MAWSQLEHPNHLQSSRSTGQKVHFTWKIARWLIESLGQKVGSSLLFRRVTLGKSSSCLSLRFLTCETLPAARSLITRLQLLGASAKELVIELLSPGSIIHRQFSLELGAVCGSRDASGLGTFISSTFSLFSPKQFLPREPGFFLSTDHTHLILARHT